MSSQKVSNVKAKPTVSQKRISLVAPSISKGTTSGGPVDSKNLNLDRDVKTDLVATNLVNQLRDFSKVGQEGAQDNYVISDLNGSELSIIKMLEGEAQNELREEDKKLREEVGIFKRDLAMKNNLVEKLMTENSDLRREMDELLSTVEDTKDKINKKLQGCSQRIQDLEEEIRSLKEENKLYQEQLQSPDQEGTNINDVKGLECHVEVYYNDAKDQMNTFYEKLNQQIADFMNLSKSQYENFNHAIQNKIDDFKREAPTHHKTSSKSEPKSMQASRYSVTAKNQISAAHKGKGTPNHLSATMSSNMDRLSTPKSSTSRKRGTTLHNLNDAAATNRSLNNYASVPTNESVRKSPKGNLTPKIKGKMSFRPSSVQAEGP